MLSPRKLVEVFSVVNRSGVDMVHANTLIAAVVLAAFLGYAVGSSGRLLRARRPQHLARFSASCDEIVSRLVGLDRRFDSLERRMTDVEQAAARTENEARMLSAHIVQRQTQVMPGAEP